MEQSNKIQRSEVWKQIYKVVSKIPRKDVDGDAADAPSVATELEELFLKLLPIQHVSNQREQLIAYQLWCYQHPEYDQVCQSSKVDIYLKAINCC